MADSTSGAARLRPGPGTLRILLLGGFTLELDDAPLPPIPSRVGRSLFAYLALNRHRAHPREELVGIFWPDLSGSRGRRRLSHTLWQIQDALGDLPGGRAPVVVSDDRLAFDTDVSYWLDVEEFERQTRVLDSDAPAATRTATLRHAVELYRGELLAGFYDDWVLIEQERLRRLNVRALAALVDLAKSRGDFEEALVHARRLTDHDPLREGAHREVMRLCVLLDRPSEALRQFERCRSVLAEELGADPAAETEDLHRRISRHRKVLSEPTLDVPVPAQGLHTHVPMTGRDDERRVLVDRMEEVLAGRGGVVLVEGDTGVGKTRLVREVADDARWRGMSVLWGTGRDPAATRPYAPMAEALVDELVPLRIEQLAHRLEPIWLREAARVLPGLDRVGRRPVVDDLTGADASRRVRESLVRIVTELGRIAPAVLVLDDLHWADRETLDVVRSLPGRLATSRLLLVLVFRAHEARERPEVWEVIRAVDRDTRPARVQLQPLTLSGTAELVRGSLGTAAVPPAVADRLHRDTGGNPLFVLETVRSLRERGWDVPEGGTADVDVPVAASIRDAIAQRLEGLDPAAREVLATAATVGPRTDLDTLARAAPSTRREVADALDLLLARGLLRREPGTFMFIHDLARRVVSDSLGARQRRDLHERVGRALEVTHPERHEELAHHFEVAGADADALHHHKLAGERALEVYAYASAADHLRRAVELSDRVPVEVERRYDLLATYERVASVLALRDEQAEILESLVELAAGRPEREIDILLRRAWLAAHTDRFGAALSAVDRALASADDRADDDGCAAALTVRGTVLLWAGQVHEAVSALERAVALRGDLGDPREADARRALGDALRVVHRYADAAEQLERALILARQHGDLRGKAEVESVLGAVRMETGAIADAERHYRQAIESCREIGFRHAEGLALMNLGNLLRVRARAAEALERYTRAVDTFRELGNGRLEATALLNLASLRHAVLGDDERARAEAERAARFFEGTGELRAAGLALDTPAGIARRAGRLEEARGLVGRALGTIDPDDAWTEVQLRRTQAEVELDAGDPAAALEVLDRALEVCREADLGACQSTGIEGLRAVALGALGRADEGLAVISRVLADLSPGVDRPYLLHLWHHRLLRAVGHEAEARRAVGRAHDQLLATLEGLREVDRRRALRDVPEHAAIAAAWHDARPETVTVPVAAADAPTGRPLRDGEHVDVVLVVDAPEDSALDDAVERRRQRLLRIIDQANQQGGAPTVKDLAAVLGVSTSTVRRDLGVLRDLGKAVPTRGRRGG